MIISKDALWKGIIESLIVEFIHFFFANYVDEIDFERGFEFLDTELQKLIPDNPGHRRHADKLIKAWLKDGQEIWFLIHVEVQGYPDPLIARRLFESLYRIGEKYPKPITPLIIYTDWDRVHHYREYRQEFMGTKLCYEFNSYTLRDHLPAELAKRSNPFAAVMEAAWLHLDRPKDEQTLRMLKLDLIDRLKFRRISREKISLIIDFIKYIAPFTNSEIQAIFEQDLAEITKTNTPMGLREAILDDVKKQGIEIGIEQGIEQGIEIGESRGFEKGIEQGVELEKREFVQKLWSLQEFSVAKIALLVGLTVERVEELILDYLIVDGKSKPEALELIRLYRAKFGDF